MAQILLIDDESNILDLLRTILVSLGHEVKVAHDGQEGIEL
jgi:CheY-like chemotaxis protein